jgi:polyhydroxybutyrate depolymerase
MPDATVSLTRQTITVGGDQRSFLLAEPQGPVAGVVLSLHGTRSGADRQARLSGMARLASGAGGAVVAFPQAVMPIGSGYEWDHDGDLPFLSQLAEQLIGRYQPPAGRVCMTGMSGGARMSCYFAASRADLTAGVGAVAGLRASGQHPPTRAVPILAFHGTADRINPYAGGSTPRWDESVADSARRWAKANHLAPEPEVVAVSSTLTRTTYGREGEPGEVTLWISSGAGHTWPGSHVGLFLRLFLGRTSQELDATEKIWAFGQQHAGDP